MEAAGRRHYSQGTAINVYNEQLATQ